MADIQESELNTCKNYLRIDADLTDDDYLLNELMLMLSKLLVAHWYTNRNILSKSTTIENPYSVTALLRHIAISSKYEKVNENDI